MKKNQKVIPVHLNNSPEKIREHLSGLEEVFPMFADYFPWDVPANLASAILRKISLLNDEYIIQDTVAIHKRAIVESGVILKGPLIICAEAFVGSHAYLRGGVYLSEHACIGPSVEVKASFIGKGSRIAHFNCVGDSLIGENVNMEAGSVIANQLNERADRTLVFTWSGKQHRIANHKFGALVGNYSCIGANAVLSPGTILPMGSIVPRLALVDQQV